ncbi:hypothetical protein GF377_08595, partial [candidate division GN15 bacterium]|nr:hypothetical protein [candidate division GN15 bacterium]
MPFQGPLNKIGDCRWEIPDSYQSESMKQKGVKMRAPGLLFADERMLETIVADNAPEQVANVATLPG